MFKFGSEEEVHAGIEIELCRPLQGSRTFCEIPGVPALEKQRFHPWLTCGHAVGVLLSGPGTDELMVPNGLSPDYYPHFFVVLIFKELLYISRIDPSMKTTDFRICR